VLLLTSRRGCPFGNRLAGSCWHSPFDPLASPGESFCLLWLGRSSFAPGLLRANSPAVAVGAAAPLLTARCAEACLLPANQVDLLHLAVLLAVPPHVRLIPVVESAFQQALQSRSRPHLTYPNRAQSPPASWELGRWPLAALAALALVCLAGLRLAGWIWQSELPVPSGGCRTHLTLAG